MANTPVFTLGLGVTVDKPVGAAFEVLHQRIERLRRQADAVRLGRIINEVIRLGLEQQKLSEPGPAADRQAQVHDAHIDRLRREGSELERLRQLYQALARQPGRAARSPAWDDERQSPASPADTRRAAPSVRVPGDGNAEPPLSGPRDQAYTKGVAVAAGVTAAVGAAYVGHRLVKRASPVAGDRARTAARDSLEMGEAAFILKTMDALGSAKDGKEAAEGVGGAVGELGGNLLGAALGGLLGKGKGAEYGGLLGGFFGEKLGSWVGGTTYELFADPVPQMAVVDRAEPAHRRTAEKGERAAPDVGSVLTSPASQRGEVGIGATQIDQGQVTLGAAAAQREHANGVAPQATGQALNGEPSICQANPTMSTKGQAPQKILPGGEKASHKPLLIGAANSVMTTSTHGRPTAEHAEGLGSVAGGLVGTLVGGAIGSVVPGFGTAVGATVGGMLGEAVGGWLGRARLDKDDEPRTVSRHAASNIGAVSIQDNAAPSVTKASTPKRETRGVPSQPGSWLGRGWVAEATTARSTAVSSSMANDRDASPIRAGSNVSREVQPMPSSSMPEPKGIGAAMRSVAKPAILKATEQSLQTLTSDKPGNEKAEGYGRAAGGLLGTLAGGVIGSVVPVIGTTFGAALGGLVGDQLGGWLGKSWFASLEKGKVTPEPVGPGNRRSDQKGAPGEVVRSIRHDQPPILTNAEPGPAGPSPVPAPAPVYNQQFTFTANMPVTVNNRLDDPLTLQHLEAIARRQLEELMRQARSVQLADTPHIAL